MVKQTMRNKIGFTLLIWTFAVMAVAVEKTNEAAFVDAVERVVKALEKKDYDTFEGYFTEVTKGLQPNELWRGAFGVLGKFGRVQRLEFSELDEGSGGAFVKVYFENATREVFVRLTDENKIRELTYVPPMNVH
jgi:hypothetical protein